MTRSRLIRWIAVSFGIAVAVLAIAILIVFTMDLSRFEDELEEYLSDFTGREFVIDGEFHASLGRTVVIRMEDAKLGNAAWSPTPHMLELGKLELRFGFWSMFRHTMRIEYLDIDGVQVLVEARDGAVNWDFDPEAEVSEWLTSQSVTQYTVEYAEIKDVSLRYGDGWLDAAQTVEVKRCVLEETNDRFLSIDLDGRLDEYVVTVAGHAGPQDNLARGEAVDLDLTMDVGDFRLVTRGHVERVEPLERPEFNFEFIGPDVADLLAELGLPVFTSGSVDLRGNLDQQPPGVKLDVTGSVGEVRLDVHGALEDLERLEDLALAFSISGPHLGELFKILDMDYLPGGTFSLSGELDGTSPPFQLHDVVVTVGDVSAEMRGTIGTGDLELDISSSGPDFAGFMRTWTESSLPEGPFELDGSVKRQFDDNVWHIVDLSVLFESGLELELDGDVEPTPEYLRVNADIAGTGPELADVFAIWLEKPVREGPFEARARLSKERDSTRYDDFEATLGGDPQSGSPADHLAGNLAFEPGHTPRITAELRSDGFNLTPYLDAVYERRTDAQPSDANPEFWFPDIPLSLDPLDLADVDVRLDARSLVLDDEEVTDLGLRLLVQDGNLTIDPLNATYRSGSVSGRLNLDDSQAVPSLSADLRFGDVVMDDPQDDEGNAVERPVLAAEISLAANGNSTGELLTSANGSIRIDEGAGLIWHDPLKIVLDAINPPLADEKYIKLECYVLHADISDGVATARAVAIQTDRLKIAARGSIKLGTEALDLQFKIAQRQGSGVSVVSIASPHVAIAGTIQNPGIVFGTGATVAAVITDGWTMVFDAFSDIASRDTNVCEEALRQAERQQQRR